MICSTGSPLPNTNANENALLIQPGVSRTGGSSARMSIEYTVENAQDATGLSFAKKLHFT